MEAEELAAIRARCNRARREPWTSIIEGRDQTSGSSFIMVGQGEPPDEDLYVYGASPDDQDFIAHARQDVPRLLDEVQLRSVTMTPEMLAAIRARCDRATGGPWSSWIEGRDHTSGPSFIMVGQGDRRGEDITLSGASNDDQDFIAHARQDVPRLLDEVMRLRNLRGA
jgi:hypothetical protein